MLLAQETAVKRYDDPLAYAVARRADSQNKEKCGALDLKIKIRHSPEATTLQATCGSGYEKCGIAIARCRRGNGAASKKQKQQRVN